MERVHILVEGQTEEAFIGRSLAPYLWQRDIVVSTRIVMTKKVGSGPDHKGGIRSWGQVERDLRRLLQDTNVVAVTTLLDYYALPSDVPGMSTRPPGSAAEKATHIQGRIDQSMGDPRMQSHLAVHELEALLYSDPDQCGSYLESPQLATAMSDAVKECGEPELVNDNPTTAPSKRILQACPTYHKTLDGPALIERIGLPLIRSACPHFNGWVSWLESLAV